MQLHIESPHFEPDEKLMELVRSRFEHLGKRYDRIGDCSVVLRKEQSDVQKCSFIEAKMELPKSTILFASEQEERFEVALDKVIDDLAHQLRKFKEELEENR
jgi:putative sigma-54 modulation protein